MNLRKIKENKVVSFKLNNYSLVADMDCYYPGIVGIGKPFYDISITDRHTGNIKRLSESECIDIIRSAFSLEETEEVNLRSF